MEQWNEIRRRVLVEGVSRRQVQRETGMHWKTLSVCEIVFGEFLWYSTLPLSSSNLAPTAEKSF